MVSLARAAECIGRPVKHADLALYSDEGRVMAVNTERELVQVQFRSGDSLWIDPEELVWGGRVYEPVMLALMNHENYEDAQIVVEFDEDMDEYVFIGSPPGANDDDMHHMLYVGLPMMRRVHPVRPTVDPWAAYLFEEALGWAKP